MSTDPGSTDAARPLPPGPLAAAAERFTRALGDAGTVAVAFSGGVDSSVVVALAARALGRDGVVAVLGVSPSLAADEHASARATAAQVGVRLVEVRTLELDDPRYVANAGDRCYFCKHELYTRSFAEVVRAQGVDLLLNGDTADDAVRGDRPGSRAAAELGVRRPLAEAGIGKRAVRELARALGLAVWDKPSAPCLASRIPVHTPVTIGDLGRVERAEAGLRRLGLRELRVRHLGARARVELAAEGQAALADPAFAEAVRAAVRAGGSDAGGYDEVEIAAAPLRRD
ncbi:ATP-dependent sacrificial sulfur transferase LarE [Geodermatophilus marinus]|uniref:ATP-dependent sacrificial sulfur transferase LarE n=1 Tax=Geodermatophilus sp. LHW52908 TaxID=2303986 RepID=UPI0018F4FA1F|nr:ATP-dependent sacrificial sulfur transferase LarE [Geodermatophilus sp. LHW52908]